jgi:cysteine-rich repeat protein
VVRLSLPLALSFALLAWACAEPRCPKGYLQYGDVCRRCPPGQVRENGLCVSEGGVALDDHESAEQDGGGQEQATDVGSADASGSQDQDIPEFDAATCNDIPGDRPCGCQPGALDVRGDGTECVDACSVTNCDASVQCRVASECADPGTCNERVCGSDGTCGSRNQADHTPCTMLGSSGVCSAGSCTGCIDDSDCHDRGPLTACNTESHRCVVPSRCGDGVAQSEAGEECDDSNEIDEDGCTNSCKRAVCGDGIVRNAGISTMLEQCDPAAPGWSTQTCSSDCRRSVYVSNRSGSCPAGTTAPLWGVCTVPCNVDADCPVVPKIGTPFCFPSVKICAIYCTEDNQCPSGLRCDNQGSGATAECNGII